MLRSLLCLSLVCLSLTATTAHADPRLAPNKVAVVVKTADFDRPEAVATLYNRLQYASKVACDTLEAEVPSRQADDRACEREAVKGAVHDINRPALTALDVRTDADAVSAKDRRHR